MAVWIGFFTIALLTAVLFVQQGPSLVLLPVTTLLSVVTVSLILFSENLFPLPVGERSTEEEKRLRIKSFSAVFLWMIAICLSLSVIFTYTISFMATPILVAPVGGFIIATGLALVLSSTAGLIGMLLTQQEPPHD